MPDQVAAATPSDDTLIDLSTEIVSAYVSHNALSVIDLPKLITDVHTALRKLGQANVPETVEKPEPAVPVKKSVTSDHLVCLEDGMKFKSLKRHLTTHHDLTADEYRKKWGLPRDYPMVAPNYSETRSRLAKDNGLGRKASAKQVTARRKGRSQRLGDQTSK